MRIAIVSDIHGNLEAFTTVLRTIDSVGVDEIVCLGDVVGYGPHPAECIALVRDRCATVVMGNHDAGVFGGLSGDHFNEYGRAAIEWTQTRLTAEDLEYLKELPMLVTRNDITYVHATPRNPSSWHYILSWPDAQRCFPAFTTDLCFIGHTHVPVAVGEDGSVNNYRNELRHLINAGSVGQPRDGNPRASFGLLDTGSGTYENTRVEYDIRATADAIAAAGLPEYLGKRLFVGI
jgi:putative phosphoesterase